MSEGKVGRNDPCPCKSGKKYKKCHGDPASHIPAPDQELSTEILQKIAMTKQEDGDHVRRYGHARELVSAEFQGHRLVAVGDEIMWRQADKAKYFGDFLVALMPTVFGVEWWDAEVAKPEDKRHPAFQWRFKAMTYQNKQAKTADGIYIKHPTGPMVAYFSFAYDLFVVKDNGRLDSRLLERLKHPDQFQGARHELFAEATCIRAGYKIEHENEADGSTRHAEFTATHKATGERVSVEAKSKHRPGILGQPGKRQSVGAHYLPVHKLLKDAVAKNTPHPLVVFLEMNLPREAANQILTDVPNPFIEKTLDRLRTKDSKRDPISLLVVTNSPEHHTEDEERANGRQLLSVITASPLKPMMKPVALKDIHQAANLSGNIPQEFPTRT
jgi:hypothetical protein